eukprot:PhF_6_TR44166/c0_g1_i1/m.67642
MHHLRIGGVSRKINSPNRIDLVPRLFSPYFQSPTITNEIMHQHLRWMIQKDELGQDMFLLGPPGPLRRRLVQWYSEVTNREVEWINLTRDASDADLQQRRELHYGNLVFVDQPPVRAAKHGRLLVIEGVDKAERNVLPILNNLLENREMNLPDGTHLRVTDKNFRVVALGIPVPKYPGYPMDPPFRSRFQCRVVSEYISTEHLIDHVQSVAGLCPKDATLLAALQEYIDKNQSIPGLYDGFVDRVVKSHKHSKNDVIEAVRDGYPIWAFPTPTTADAFTTLNKSIMDTPECPKSKRPTTQQLLEESAENSVCVVGASGTGKSSLIRNAFRDCSDDVITIQCYKDMTTRELLMRRDIDENGNTVWVMAPLVLAALRGCVVILDGIHRLDAATLCALQPLAWDRELSLPDGTRLISAPRYAELLKVTPTLNLKQIRPVHQNFRLIVTALPPTSELPWMTSEAMSMFQYLVFPPPDMELLAAVINDVGLNKESELGKTLLHVAKTVSLTPRQLRRVARRCSSSKSPSSEEIANTVSRAIMVQLMPTSLRQQMQTSIENALASYTQEPSVVSQSSATVSENEFNLNPEYKAPESTGGVIPTILFFPIPYQTRILNSMLHDYLNGERFFLLIGNQGTGKNKICDYFLQRMGREREYMQLHRDVTVQSLTVNCVVNGGKVSWEDSPLVIAVKHGRMLVIDEADKAPLEVVVILKNLVEDKTLLLHNGETIKITSPDFGVIVLANRPGYPFLGNDFFQECGEVFTSYVVDNADTESEVQLLSQYAPSVPREILVTLSKAFGEMRALVEQGALTYPFSTRELVNIVKHFAAYPQDGLAEALRNVLNFEAFNQDVYEQLTKVLRNYGIPFQQNVGVSIVQAKRSPISTIPWPMLKQDTMPSETVAVQSVQIKCRNVSFELGSSVFREDDVEAHIPREEGVSETVLDLHVPLIAPNIATHITTSSLHNGYVMTTTNLNSIRLIAPKPASSQWSSKMLDFSFIVGKIHAFEKVEGAGYILCGLDHGYVFTLTESFDGLIHYEIPAFMYPKTAQRTSRRYTNYDDSFMIIRSCNTSVCIANKSTGNILVWKVAIGNKDSKPQEPTSIFIELGTKDAFQQIYLCNENLLCVVQAKLLTYYLLNWNTPNAVTKWECPFLQPPLPGVTSPIALTLCNNYLVLEGSAKDEASGVVTITHRTNAVSANVITGLNRTGRVVSVNDDGVILRANDAYLEVIESRQGIAVIRKFDIPDIVAATPVPDSTTYDWIVMRRNGHSVLLVMNDAKLQIRVAQYVAMSGGTQNTQDSTTDDKSPSQSVQTGDGSGSGEGDGQNGQGGSGRGGSGGSGSGGSGGGTGSGNGGGQGGTLTSTGMGGYAATPEGKLIAQAVRARVQRALGTTSSTSTAMSSSFPQYATLYNEVEPLISALRNVWNSAAAKEKERTWLRGQSQGDLDDNRVVDAVIGDSNVFRRRGKATPVLGLPQRHPKYIHLVMDLSASMSRFNGFDKRLDLCAQAAILVMESLHPYGTKFKLSMSGHSGSSDDVMLLDLKENIANPTVRGNVIERMYNHSMMSQSGDHTLEGIQKAAKKLRDIPNADDRIVIAFSDANLGGYGITPDALKACVMAYANVGVYVVFVAEPKAATYLLSELPPLRANFLTRPNMIPTVIRDLLRHTVERE